MPNTVTNSGHCLMMCYTATLEHSLLESKTSVEGCPRVKKRYISVISTVVTSSCHVVTSMFSAAPQAAPQGTVYFRARLALKDAPKLPTTEVHSYIGKQLTASYYPIADSHCIWTIGASQAALEAIELTHKLPNTGVTPQHPIHLFPCCRSDLIR